MLAGPEDIRTLNARSIARSEGALPLCEPAPSPTLPL